MDLDTAPKDADLAGLESSFDGLLGMSGSEGCALEGHSLWAQWELGEWQLLWTRVSIWRGGVSSRMWRVSGLAWRDSLE